MNSPLEYDYTGTFESHITVAAPNAVMREKFRLLCQTLGIKCVLIELPTSGFGSTQPMTASYHHGTLKNVLVEVRDVAQQLVEAGFEVKRIKVEAMVSNRDVPADDNEAQALPASNYFEFHVKVTLPGDANLQVLGNYCAQWDAHLSANALKYQTDGQQQRFITMRLYGVGRHSAQARFNALLKALKAKGLKLSNPQREYTVYDSNTSLDAGWIGRQT